MWSTPIERTAPDGSNYHLVLLDTEGIDAYDQVAALHGAQWTCAAAEFQIIEAAPITRKGAACQSFTPEACFC